MEQHWRRRKRHQQIVLEAKAEPAQPISDLDTLMAEADAAAARALDLAMRLTPKRTG